MAVDAVEWAATDQEQGQAETVYAQAAETKFNIRQVYLVILRIALNVELEWLGPSVMKKEFSEIQKQYLQRVNIYKELGYDIEKERKLILEKSQPIYGDILEVGTGKGHFAVALAKARYSFITIDISKEEQEIARQSINYFGLEKFVDFRIENAESLSFSDGSFDIIFSINMLHHLDNPFRVIDELLRVLSFEGKIILSDFNKEGMKIINSMHSSEGRIHPVSHISLSEVENYLANKGFKLEKYQTKLQDVIVAFHQLM